MAALTNSTSMFAIGGTIATSLESTSSGGDNALSAAIKGTQVLENVSVTPGNDHGWIDSLNKIFDVKETTQDILTRLLDINSPWLNTMFTKLDTIANNIAMISLNRPKTADEVKQKAKEAQTKFGETSEDYLKYATSIGELLSNTKLYNPVKIKSFAWGVNAVTNAIAKSLKFLLSETSELEEVDKISYIGDFINNLNEIITNAQSLSNPIKAVGFKAGTRIFSSGIESLIKTLKNSAKDTDFSQIDKPLSIISTLANLASSEETGGFTLNAGWFSFKGTKIKLSEKAAKRFSSVMTKIVDAFVDNVKKLNGKGLMPTEARLQRFGSVISQWLSPLGVLSTSNYFTKKNGQQFNDGIWAITNGIVNSLTEISTLQTIPIEKVKKINEALTLLLESIFNVPKNINKTIIKTAKGLSAIIKSFELADKVEVPKSLLTTIDQIVEKFSSKEAITAQKTMKGFAVGISTLGLALSTFAILTPVVLVAALGIKAFGWAIKGLTDKHGPVKSMALFSVSLATFGIAIWAFGEVVTGESMIKTVGGLVVLYLATNLFSGDGLNFGKWNIKAGKPSWKNVMLSAVALASVGLAIHYGFKDLEGMDILKVAGGIGAIALAMNIWAKLKITKAQIANMIACGVGIAAIGLGLQSFRGLDMNTILVATVGVAGIGLAMKVLENVKINPKDILGVLAAASGIGVLGIALQLWNGVTWETIGMAAAGMGAITIALAVLGNVPKALIGAASLAAGAGSILILGLAMKNFVGVDWNTFGVMAATVGLTSGAIIGLGFLPNALLGAAALAAGGGALLMVALGVRAFPLIAPEQLFAMGTFVAEYGVTIAAIGLAAPLIFIGSAALSVAGMAMLPLALGATALKDTEKKTFDVMSYGITSIRDTFSDGFFEYAKASLGARTFLPTALTMVPIAKAMNLIGSISVDAKELKAKVGIVSTFVSTCTNIFGNLGLKQMVNIRKGIAAVSGLGNVVKSIAEGVQAIAGLRFYEYEVDSDGNIKIKSVRSFTDKDFGMVGVGLSKMINALSKPLAEIGEKTPKFKLWNGLEVPVPGGNLVKLGINAIGGLGELVANLAEGLKVAAEANLKPELYESFANGISTFIVKVQEPFAKIGASTEGKGFMGLFRGKADVQRGIEAMQGIGDVLSPITELASAFTEGEGNVNKGELFRNSVAPFIEGMDTIIKWVEGGQKVDTISYVWTAIANSISSITSTNIKTLGDDATTLVSALTNDKWTKAFSNLDKLSSKLKTIAGNLKNIEYTKLVITESSIKESEKSSDSEQILALIDTMLQLIEKINEKATIINSSTSSSSISTSSTTNNPSSPVSGGNTPAQQVQTITKADLQQLVYSIEDAIKSLSDDTIKVRIQNWPMNLS